MEFKDKIKKLRTDANLSQEALADLIHVSRSAIAKYENGGGKPSEETLQIIADYFKVDIDYLKDDVETKKKKRPLVGFIFTIACGALSIIAIIIALVIYNQCRLTAGNGFFASFYVALSLLSIFFILIFIVVTSLIGFLLMVVKTGKKKLIPTLTAIAPLLTALTITGSGILITRAQYNDYKTFTVERWAKAKDDHDYRGLLIDSFLEQYNITGYSELKVDELLGSPDWINETNTIWNYGLGSEGFHDTKIFEITYDSLHLVSSYRVFSH